MHYDCVWFSFHKCSFVLDHIPKPTKPKSVVLTGPCAKEYMEKGQGQFKLNLDKGGKVSFLSHGHDAHWL